MQVQVLSRIPVKNNVVPSVMAAQLSVKQLGRVRFPGSTQQSHIMKFKIDESYLCNVTVREEWGVYDHIKQEDLTHEQLIKILKGEDRCSSTSSTDHPEFAKLREQLGSEGFIKIERAWWNDDQVTKTFTLNGKKFKIGEKFVCGAAMKGHMKYR